MYPPTLCTYTNRKELVQKKPSWKKLAGHSNTLLDIVTRTQRPGKLSAKNKEDDFKTRRRRLYRLITEEKQAFPFQQRNFFNYVMENKEVVKTLSLLSTCTLDMKQVKHKIRFTKAHKTNSNQ